MSADQPLSEGVVGREIVKYFAENYGTVAVDAKSIESKGHDMHDYEITFEHGITQAYRVTFAAGFSFEILDATPLN